MTQPSGPRWIVLGCLAVGVLAANSAPCRADAIFSYSVTPSTTSITGGGNTVTITGASASGQNASFPGGVNENLLTFSVSSSGSVTKFSSPVNFSVTVTDKASGKSTVINFTGKIAGSLGTGSSSLLFTFSPTGAIPFNLGNLAFTLTIASGSEFILTGDNLLVENFSADALGPHPSVPEPSTFVLWGMIGACGLWFGHRRMRFKSAA
jgi:hypothetical protein